MHKNKNMSNETVLKKLNQLIANSEKLLDLMLPAIEKPKTAPEKKLKKYLINRNGKPKKPEKHYKPLPKTWQETIKSHLETGNQTNPFTIEQLLTDVLHLDPTDFSHYAKAKIYKHLMLNGECSTATKRSDRSREWYWFNGEKIQRENTMQKYKDGFELCYYPASGTPDELNDLI